MVVFSDRMRLLATVAADRHVPLEEDQPVLAEAICFWTDQLAVHPGGGSVGRVQTVLDTLSTM